MGLVKGADGFRFGKFVGSATYLRVHPKVVLPRGLLRTFLEVFGGGLGTFDIRGILFSEGKLGPFGVRMSLKNLISLILCESKVNKEFFEKIAGFCGFNRREILGYLAFPGGARSKKKKFHIAG